MEKSCIWNFKIVEDRKLPKSWEEFLRMFPGIDVYLLPDRAINDAVNTLCKLIWLRNCYNGDWKPDWYDKTHKYFIEFFKNEIRAESYFSFLVSPFFFKTAELRDEFMRNFRSLLEKIKPLFGIYEGGEK